MSEDHEMEVQIRKQSMKLSQHQRLEGNTDNGCRKFSIEGPQMSF